jgi:hypothetical protein
LRLFAAMLDSIMAYWNKAVHCSGAGMHEAQRKGRTE